MSVFLSRSSIPSSPTKPLECIRQRRLTAPEMQLIAGSETAVQIMKNRLRVHIERSLQWERIYNTLLDWLEEQTTDLYLLETDKTSKFIYIGFQTTEEMLLFKLRFDGMKFD